MLLILGAPLLLALCPLVLTLRVLTLRVLVLLVLGLLLVLTILALVVRVLTVFHDGSPGGGRPACRRVVRHGSQESIGAVMQR